MVGLLVAGACAGCGAATSTGASTGANARPSTGTGCSTAVAAAPRLSAIHTTMIPVPGRPFGAVTTSNGAWSFISVDNSIAVFSDRPHVSRRFHSIQVPGQPLGEALTHDGRDLLVADESGAAVISVQGAERGSPNAVTGMLTSPAGASGGAIEALGSRDNRYAFVTLEDSNDLAVFNLGKALANGFGPSDFVGTVPLGLAPVGMAMSPNGEWLYATSEVEGRSATRTAEGSLSVINVARAETDPAAAVAITVVAGCSPVRVITSGNGSVVWVTARGSDSLLGFSAAQLLSDPHHALLADVGVGKAPVGLALVDGGKQIVVADSNRFSARGAVSNLAVVGTKAALASQPALLGVIPAGLFPREMTAIPGANTLLVTNYASNQLEAVDLAGLP